MRGSAGQHFVSSSAKALTQPWTLFPSPAASLAVALVSVLALPLIWPLQQDIVVQIYLTHGASHVSVYRRPSAPCAAILSNVPVRVELWQFLNQRKHYRRRAVPPVPLPPGAPPRSHFTPAVAKAAATTAKAAKAAAALYRGSKQRQGSATSTSGAMHIRLTVV